MNTILKSFYIFVLITSVGCGSAATAYTKATDHTAAVLTVVTRMVSVVYGGLTPGLQADTADEFADIRDGLLEAARALDNDAWAVTISEIRAIGVKVGLLGARLAELGCGQKTLELLFSIATIIKEVQ